MNIGDVVILLVSFENDVYIDYECKTIVDINKEGNLLFSGSQNSHYVELYFPFQKLLNKRIL
jgi:hypothetical protein